MANRKKVALVTDSNRGIGFETARQLGEQGMTVIVTARSEQDAEQVAGKLRGEGIEGVGIALDVAKPGIAPRPRNSSSRTSAGWTFWSITPV